MTEQSFEKLKTWQKAHQLMLEIHQKLLPLLPKEEKYDLVDQRRRSSKSVPANIAARDLGCCPISLYEDLRSQIEEIRRLLNGYITWLKAKKVGENEPGAKLSIHEISPEYLIVDKG